MHYVYMYYQDAVAKTIC